MLYHAIRPLLFALEAEEAHAFSFQSLKILNRFIPFKPDYHPVRVMGLTFPNRVGLAAGLDKNGAYSDVLFKMGFGFVEIGTLTPKPQTGNPQPRLFRLKEDKAIINRMGFNNEGVDAYVHNHSRLPRYGILGINIGKNKDTPQTQAIEDYLYGYRHVYPYADYVTINVSSPNTPGLRLLESGEALSQLLEALTEARKQLMQQYERRVPLCVKLSPDLHHDDLKETIDILVSHQIDAVVATNTTLGRDKLKSALADEHGGLSGKPLTEQSLEVISRIHHHCPALPIIGVGGIMSAQDAQDKIEAGASLVQLYTGFIYKGPKLVRQVVKALSKTH